LKARLLGTAALPLIAAVAMASGQASQGHAKGSPFLTLYEFAGGSDGYRAGSIPVADKSGNFYGATWQGGASNAGTVYKLAPDGTHTILYSFSGGVDGKSPLGGPLAMDDDGNLYGTTQYGGASGAGTIFKLAPDGTETVLYSFADGSDGRNPTWSVIRDYKGNLYGTTQYGGGGNCGTLFEFTRKGVFKLLHTLTNSEGCFPRKGVIRDASGNLFGTAEMGGQGFGTVFKYAADGTFTVLHKFTNDGSDGGTPGALTLHKGNLYGVTAQGGGLSYYGDGALFEVSSDGQFEVLYDFDGTNHAGKGSIPTGPVFVAKDGSILGTTQAGGANGGGEIFKITPTKQEVILYSFSGTPYANGGLIKSGTAGKGYLFGTTWMGGAHSAGSVFAVKMK
jgi:uncharacterized repeat protein (TIGR03803 family)